MLAQLQYYMGVDPTKLKASEIIELSARLDWVRKEESLKNPFKIT